MNANHLLKHFNDSQWLSYVQSVEQTGTFPVAFTVSMVVIFIAGMVGNVVTCVVIYCDRSMHTVTNYYLFHLAISDLVVLLAMVVEVIFHSGQFAYPRDKLGEVVCKVHGFMIGALWNNGILIITSMSIERYAAIVHPLLVKTRRVRRTMGQKLRRRGARVMAGVWSAALLVTLPDLLTITLIHTPQSTLCFVTLTRYARLVHVTVAVGTFLLPLAIMLYVYTAIAVTVNTRQKSSYGDNIFNHRNNGKRINKLLIALTLSFLVCWLPYFSLRLVVALGDPHTLLAMAQYWELWYEVVSMCSWFSSVLNPLLFSLMSTKFRKALKNLVYTKLLRRHMEHFPV